MSISVSLPSLSSSYSNNGSIVSFEECDMTVIKPMLAYLILSSPSNFQSFNAPVNETSDVSTDHTVEYCAFCGCKSIEEHDHTISGRLKFVPGERRLPSSGEINVIKEEVLMDEDDISERTSSSLKNSSQYILSIVGDGGSILPTENQDSSNLKNSLISIETEKDSLTENLNDKKKGNTNTGSGRFKNLKTSYNAKSEIVMFLRHEMDGIQFIKKKCENQTNDKSSKKKQIFVLKILKTRLIYSLQFDRSEREGSNNGDGRIEETANSDCCSFCKQFSKICEKTTIKAYVNFINTSMHKCKEFKHINIHMDVKSMPNNGLPQNKIDEQNIVTRDSVQRMNEESVVGETACCYEVSDELKSIENEVISDPLMIENSSTTNTAAEYETEDCILNMNGINRGLIKQLNSLEQKDVMISSDDGGSGSGGGLLQSVLDASNISKYECLVCLKRFRKIDSYFKHKELHNAEMEKKRRIHICDICSKSFKRKPHLTNHVRSVHLKLKDFQCEFNECVKAFTSLSSLNSHMRIVHGVGELPVCEYCSKTFCRQSTLNLHIRTVHKHIDARLLCTTCGKVYERRDNLEKHVAICMKKHDVKIKIPQSSENQQMSLSDDSSMNEEMKNQLSDDQLLLIEEGDVNEINCESDEILQSLLQTLTPQPHTILQHLKPLPLNSLKYNRRSNESEKE